MRPVHGWGQLWMGWWVSTLSVCRWPDPLGISVLCLVPHPVPLPRPDLWEEKENPR